ncbi:hypothetical protein UQ90_02330 [Shigella dysenteriae]|nr:hypothetical protein UQ90_02330 [Shigella dysenteriae]
MDGFLHQASFVTGNWCYDRHCSVRLVICFDLAIDQIAQSGLSSLKVIYYSAQLFSCQIFREFNSLKLRRLKSLKHIFRIIGFICLKIIILDEHTEKANHLYI